MSKNLKKYLLIGVSTLTLLFMGAGAFNNPVNARRHYRTHRTYHHRAHHNALNAWYEHNGKKLKRRDLYHNRRFTQGWNDSHYQWSDLNWARVNPRHNNANYRHGWIIGRTYANNGRSFKHYYSYTAAIHEYQAGSAYASLYNIHHDVYKYHTSNWEPNASKAANENI